MNTNELYANVATNTKLHINDVRLIVTEMVSQVHGFISKGSEVTIPHLGTFAVSKKPARVGRNPRTGESLEISARANAKFKPAGKLKAAALAVPV